VDYVLCRSVHSGQVVVTSPVLRWCGLGVDYRQLHLGLMHPDQGGSKKKVRSFSEDLFGFEGPAEDGSSPRAF
jgi:hypothetical protein